MNALQHAWAARAPRERVALGLAGGVLLAAALWVWAIEPLITAGARAEKRLPELHRQAAEIDRLAKQAGELRAQAANRQVFHFPPTAIPDGPYRQSETGKK